MAVLITSDPGVDVPISRPPQLASPGSSGRGSRSSGESNRGPTAPAQKKLRIAVVDDDREDFIILRNELLKSGIGPVSVECAPSVSAAYRLLARQTFDLVIVDYVIGPDSGLDFIRDMGGSDAPFPMILLSGKADSDTDLEALRAGATDFLDKNRLNAYVLERTIRYARTRHEIEQRLRESEQDMRGARDEAERANKAKSDFLAHMSHELRTPLNAIIGFSEIIANQIVEPVGKRSREYAAAIQESGKHLLSVINDMLDLSMIETGHLVLNEEEVDLRVLVEEAVRTLIYPGAPAIAPIDVRVPADLPRVVADRRAMKQVLVNLVSNAAKFTPANGAITVTARLLHDGRLHLSVTDTGPGIASENIPKVLQPFGQVKDLYLTQSGTGIGLPLARALVQRHGGSMMIHSAPDAGTTVEIHLPAERTAGRSNQRGG